MAIRLPRSTRVVSWSLAACLLVADVIVIARASPDDPPPGGAPGKAKPPETVPAGKKCLDCHAGLLARRTTHAPAARGECAACHEQEGEKHTFRPAEKPEDLCLQCHEMKLEGNVHDPVTKGRCTACHDPHASDRPRLAKSPDPDLCGQCHGSVKGPRRQFVHGPFAVGSCQVCHAPHASPNGNLLKRPGAGLCLSCHEPFVSADGKPVAEHAPAKDDCTQCHSGHESGVKYMLKSEPPALCVSCHEDVGARAGKAAFPHGAMARPGGCIVCHEAHVSRNARLLRAEPADLCLGCHDREYAHAGRRPLADMAKQLAALPNRHGPVREKSCEGCHDAHGSPAFRLLRKQYPARFYAPFSEENFALCLSCHPKETVELERSRATGFRDGDRNLHFLHVNRKKGRTCRACHEVHASTLPHHLRETTPFGEWDVPIGFEPAPAGGSCAPGCHTRQTYDRGR